MEACSSTFTTVDLRPYDLVDAFNEGVSTYINPTTRGRLSPIAEVIHVTGWGGSMAGWGLGGMLLMVLVGLGVVAAVIWLAMKLVRRVPRP